MKGADVCEERTEQREPFHPFQSVAYREKVHICAIKIDLIEFYLRTAESAE